MVFACRRKILARHATKPRDGAARVRRTRWAISWAHDTKQGGMARAAIAVEVSPGAVVAASGEGGRHR